MIFVKYSLVTVLFTNQKKKSHTCKEGGAQLRISLWQKQLFIKKTVKVGQ